MNQFKKHTIKKNNQQNNSLQNNKNTKIINQLNELDDFLLKNDEQKVSQKYQKKI